MDVDPRAPQRALLRTLTTVAAVAFAALLQWTPAAAAVPAPVVTGPIIATAAPGDASHNYPFFASDRDLASYGYVEDEYFVSGTANQYNTPTLDVNNPPSATGTVTSTNNPYRIRIIVRRPANMAKFSGVVLVEWLNVTNGFEYDTQWIRAFDYMMRSGHVFVGAGVQRVGIHQTPNGLKAWSPNRYSSLDVTANNTINDDSLKYDIFSQVAKAMRTPVGADPLQGARPALVIGTGDSQSTSNIATYANSVHVLDPIYDGFAVAGSLGNNVRTDLQTRYFKINSEYDVINNEARVRRPDTPTFVTWEVAGASHSDYHNFVFNSPVRVRDVNLTGTPPGTVLCTLPARSRTHYYLVNEAMYERTIGWIKRGLQPPVADPIAIADFTTSPRRAARDSYGIALGGIRLADVDVPAALNTGWNTGLIASNNGTCAQTGVYIPFDPAVQQTVNVISAIAGETYALPSQVQLYANHDSYVQRVMATTKGNVRSGFLLKQGGEVVIDDAASSPVRLKARATQSIAGLETP